MPAQFKLFLSQIVTRVFAVAYSRLKRDNLKRRVAINGKLSLYLGHLFHS